MINAACNALGIPEPVREFRFHPERRWRFDFAWPDASVALEIEGGIYCSGRHVRPSGYAADCEKYNEAQLCGWRVFRLVRHRLRHDILSLLSRIYHAR